jgi:hypothetical protein
VSNNLLTIDMVTNETLRVLMNNLSLVKKVNRQYDPSFAVSGAKIGSTLRIRKPNRYVVSDGPNLVTQDNDEQWTTLTVSTQKQIGMGFTSAEFALSLDEFKSRYIDPAASQLAATIDADVASVYKWIGNSVGTPGTTPATSQVILSGQQLLDEMACPREGRFAVINPAANAALVEGTKGLFNPTGTISKQYNTGNMGSALGLPFDMSQSINTFTTGSRTATGTTGAAVSTNGSTTITLAGMGAGGTILQGDVFTIAGVFAVNPQTRQSTGSLFQFCVLANAVADGGGAATVTVAPIYDSTVALATVNSLPANGAVVTFRGAASTGYPQNLILHPDAVTFATADLVLPKGIDMGSRAQADGISIRIIRDYDIGTDRLETRLDVLYGFAVQRDALACRLWG